MNPLTQQIDQKSREIDDNFRKFFSQVNGTLSWVPDALEYLVDPIIKSMNLLATATGDFWKWLEEQKAKCGDEDRLDEVGEQWVNKVGNVLGDIAGTIGLDKLRTNIEWTGRAARAYHDTVPPQAAGLNAIKDIANQMRASLNSLANSVEGFRLAMYFALGGFVVAGVAAIAGALSVVGIPAAIATIGAALGASISLIGAASMAMATHMNTIETEQMTIAQKIHDLGSSWARPNTRDMSDASVADGDSSDWRLEE